MYNISYTTQNAFMWLLNNLNTSYVYSVQNGTLNPQDPRGSFGVVPVLYLKSDITLSGTGTQKDPYTINS